MIVDNSDKDKSLLIDGLEETIPKNHKVKIHAEIKTATHSVGPSGAIISTGTAEVTTDVIDMETDQESPGDLNNAVELDTSELRELDALEAKGENEEELDLKLLDKSQEDVSTYKQYKVPPVRPKDLELATIITIIVIGRITNSTKRTLKRRLVPVQCQVCNNTTSNTKRIINSLNSLCVKKRLLFCLYFSIYVYMLKTIVFIHTLHKILIKESQKIHNCIPYRLELKNWTPVENKEQAETNQNKLKNMDENLYQRPGRMPSRLLGDKGDQSEKCKGPDEIKDDIRSNQRQKSMIKSYRCWKTRKKKPNIIVMIKS